jgi:hypothetical protein
MRVQRLNSATGEFQEIPDAAFDPAVWARIMTRREIGLRGAPDDQVAALITELGLQTRAAPVVPESYNAEEHTVEVIFTTGARVKRWGWEEDYYEELDPSPEAINFDRIVGAPYLNAHSRWSLEDVIGVIERGWTDQVELAGEQALPSYLVRDDGDTEHSYVGKALVRFSQRDTVNPIEADVADRILRQVSVGYSVQDYEKISRKSELGEELGLDLPLYIARAWTPMEISQVPIGADGGATVRSRSDDSQRMHRCVVSVPIAIASAGAPAPSTREGDTMIRVRIRSTGATEEIRAQDYNRTLHELLDEAGREAVRAAGLEPEPAAAVAPARADDSAIEAARVEGADLERTRAAGIRVAVRQGGLGDEIATELIGQANVTLDQAREAVLERLAAESDTQAVRGSGLIPVGGGQEEDTTRRASVVDALMHRANPGVHPVTDQGREYIGMSLVEIARNCLEVRGEPHRGLSKMELVGRAITVGGSDLPNIVANVANKSLLDGYTGAPRTFVPWCRRATLPDFKPVSRVQYGKVPALVEVGEHGEFRYAEVADSAETYALLTYGRIIGITRQVIVNDDMDALSRTPALFGRAGADLESNLVYTVLTANAAMSDAVALFNAAHGNYTASGTVISIASLGVGRALMRQQTGLEDDSPINVAARYLLVPSALETLAQQMVAPISESFLRPDAVAAINPFAGTLEPIAEPRLDAASVQSWYLIADPAAVDTIEYGFLEGEEGIVTEQRQGFEVDGLEVKARLDFGVKAIDWRGMYKNVGA